MTPPVSLHSGTVDLCTVMFFASSPNRSFLGFPAFTAGVSCPAAIRPFFTPPKVFANCQRGQFPFPVRIPPPPPPFRLSLFCQDPRGSSFFIVRPLSPPGHGIFLFAPARSFPSSTLSSSSLLIFFRALLPITAGCGHSTVQRKGLTVPLNH